MNRLTISSQDAQVQGISFSDLEIPLLRVLVKLGSSARTVLVYPEREKMMNLDPAAFSEEYSTCKGGEVKWKNKTAWAREYLKRKRQMPLPDRPPLAQEPLICSAQIVDHARSAPWIAGGADAAAVGQHVEVKVVVGLRR